MTKIISSLIIFVATITFSHFSFAQENNSRPELFGFKQSESQVDENFSWTAIGGYKIENGMFQVEIKGKLLQGKFLVDKTKLFKKSTTIKKNSDTKDSKDTKDNEAKDTRNSIDSNKSSNLNNSSNEYTEYNKTDLFDRFGFVIIREKEDFTLSFKIPKGSFKMQLVVKRESDGKIENYEFEIMTSDKWPSAPPPSLTNYLCERCMTVNAGLNYINFKNAVDSSLGPGAKEYSSFSIPSLQLSYRQKINRLSGLRVDYILSTGSPMVSKSYSIMNKTIRGQNLWLNYEMLSQPNGQLLGTKYSTGYVFSIYQNTLPYIKYVSAPDVITIDKINSTSLSAGGFFGLKLWNSEFITQMKFQLPLSPSGFSFDGSIGWLNGGSTEASKSKNFWGIVWAGQFHSYSIKVPLANDKGSYSYFLSKIDLVYGLNF